MKKQLVVLLITLFALLINLSTTTAVQSTLDLGQVELCSVIRGNGQCQVQPYGAYAPGARVWGRVELSNLVVNDDTADLELVMEIQDPDGALLWRGPVIDGQHTVPAGNQTFYVVATYDLAADATDGDYILRLALHDRLADARSTAETQFSVQQKEQLHMTLPVELSGRNLAAQITAHGVALTNEIAGQSAPAGQLFLLVDTSWRNLLPDRIYGVRLEMLQSVTIDGQLDYPFADLGKTLEGALPVELYIDPGQQTRGLLTFVVPAEFKTAALRFQDDVIGQGDIVIPLINEGEIEFPKAGTGEPGVIPTAGDQPVSVQEVEPNNSQGRAVVMPSAQSLIIEGVLELRSDQDWYQLTVNTPEPMLWSFDLDGVPEVNLLFSLVGEQGGRLLGMDGSGLGQGQTLHDVQLTAGSYYLVISSREGENPDFPYRLVARVTGQPQAGQEYEVNNNNRLASPLAIGETVIGKLAFKGDEDWYQLTVEEESSIALTLSPSPQQDLILTLHQEDMQRLSMINLGEVGEPEQTTLRLMPGIYYARITGEHDPARRYAFSVLPIRLDGLNQDLEPNNTQAEANPIEEGVLIDGCFDGGEEDWYVIENPYGDGYVVKVLLWGLSNAQVGVFDPAGSKISETEARTTFTYAPALSGPNYIRTQGVRSNYKLVVWFDPAAPRQDPREAAQLGLNTLLPSAVNWQTQNNCFGCHVQSMAIMGGALGYQNGYQVNADQMDLLVRYVQAQQADEYNYGGSSPLTQISVSGMALALHEELLSPSDPVDLTMLAGMAEYLVQEQRSDGRWTHSRSETPVQQGDFQATADAIQILSSAAGDYSTQIASGAQFLAESEPETTQDRVYRIIGLIRSGDPQHEEAVYAEVETLWERQNPDGGWAEVDGLGSSPYATGEVLYAFKLAGVSVSDPRFTEGVRWLVEHQEPDGHWEPLNSSVRDPARASTFPPTMWATIGLAGTLEQIAVEITSPEPHAVVEGETFITAEATTTGSTPVRQVLFQVNDELICLDEEAPYECVWSAPPPAAAHKIKVIALDTAGRTGESMLFTSPLEGDGTLQVSLGPDAERPVPPNIEIVLDASGSMWELMDGRARIEVAREVLAALFQELPDEVNVALRAYGHQYHYSQQVCTDTELLVPLSPLDRTSLTDEVNSMEPQGNTLIGYSLSQVADDLSAAEGRSVVVLVSDGEETCGSDPCKAADDLIASGLPVQIHVIGFAIDDPAISDQLACIAEVTGGSYLQANNAEQLIAALREAMTVEYVVYDDAGGEVARGLVDGEAVTLPAGRYWVEVLTQTPLTAEEILVQGETLTSLTVTGEGTVELSTP